MPLASHQTLATLAVAAALTLPCPIDAQSRPASSPEASRSLIQGTSNWIHSLLSLLWEANGSGLDPSGVPANGDNGSGLDPSGKPDTDAGSSLDPSGRT
jgi:hypothetical protein